MKHLLKKLAMQLKVLLLAFSCFTQIASAAEISTAEQCNHALLEVESLFLKTDLSANDMLKFADEMDVIRMQCSAGNFDGSDKKMAMLKENIISASTAK